MSVSNYNNTPNTRSGPSHRGDQKSPATRRPSLQGTPKPERTSAQSSKRKSSILSVAVTALVVPGLFATVALPAYALVPQGESEGAKASAALTELVATDAQTVIVEGTAAQAVEVKRDAFGATSEAELRRQQYAREYASFSGPSVRDFLKNPPYPNFSLAQVAAVARQYEGVPYRYGGANPSGFDCSGLTQYVYAQFGISLPHSGSGQARMGTKISRADAKPGDVVIIGGGSHVGIYLGNGNMVDAPRAGRTVNARPIWTSNYYIVRFGI